MMKLRVHAARFWSAVTCHRFVRFGDLSPKQGRVQRPGRFGRLPGFDGDKSPPESADKSAHSKEVGGFAALGKMAGSDCSEGWPIPCISLRNNWKPNSKNAPRHSSLAGALHGSRGCDAVRRAISSTLPVWRSVARGFCICPVKPLLNINSLPKRSALTCSSRWVQFKDKSEDMGKNFDTFAPMGPCLVTANEIPDPAKLRLSLRLNSQLMQDRTNEDWCFPLPRLLEWLTMGTTLEPGDVITTGTPAGIGFFRKPQIFLKPGDVCELEISGIGRLVNPVVKDEYKFLTSPNS